MTVTREFAETTGLKALSWLAGNDDLLPVFMGSSGVSEADLRENISNPVFYAAIVDFLMMDDAWVIAFCDSEGLSYGQMAEVRAALPGGDAVHWT